jgi:nucleoside-diphosphate-sugar epimerase
VITVALTGATGFIGGVLLRHLTEQGFQVKALYRPASSSFPTPTNSVRWQAGDLADQESLRAFVAGADAVVHCAGAVRGTTLQQFKQINTEGVARLLQVVTEQMVSRFLLISSLAARVPSLSAYASSKKLGEDVLREYHDRISWDILRPPAVYGPGDREMLPLLQLIKRGIVPIIGAKEGRFSLLYVDDLAAAVSCLLKARGTQQGQCFELHDGHPGGYSWRQIASIATDLNGKKPRCLAIPRPLLQSVSLANVSLARLLGYQPMLTPGKVREIFHSDWVCDNTAICRATDWQPQVQFREGMRRLFY